MERSLVLTLILAMLVGATALTRSDAYQQITNDLLASDLDGRAILALNGLVAGGDYISDVHGQTYRAPSTSYFFLVDDHFTANWDHPCRYVFVDYLTGEMTIHAANAPVRHWQSMDELFTSTVSDGLIRGNTYSLPVAVPKAMLESGKKMRLDNTSGENYAILLSGGYDAYNNWSRYYGDIYWILNSLKNDYAYTNDRIFVAMSDGLDPTADQHTETGYINSDPDIDQDGLQEIGYAATIADFTHLVNDIAAEMTSDDNLFVFITDHGGGNGLTACISLWNRENMLYTSFKELMDAIPHATFNACNEVCMSGGLIFPYEGEENVVIATACSAYQSSWSRPGHLYDYNEFAFWWTGAVHGSTPENHDCSAADTDEDGFVNMTEAFLWAKAHDVQIELPQYYENPKSFGTRLYLGGLFGSISLIITSINATGKVDRITVNWTVNDTSKLAGFNLYRSVAGNSARFERLNARPIVGESPFHYDDLAVIRGQKYVYHLETVETTGFNSYAEPVYGQTNDGLPTNFALNVYPNPAHGTVRLDYSIASTYGETSTHLSVIDLYGRTIRILVNGSVSPGSYYTQWDGTDSTGHAVSSGVYIIRMKAGGQHLTEHIVFAR